jgi:hypothetical protein
MRCSLAENTRPPWHSIYTPTLVREKKKLGHLRLQAPTTGSERRDWKRWVLLHHTTSIIQVLYIPPCAVHTATHACDLCYGVAWWHFLRTKITRWFGFLTPFEIAPTRVYYRELLVHSLEKEVIREGEGVCEGQNLEAVRR